MMKRSLCIESPCHFHGQHEQLVVSYARVKGMEEFPDKPVPIEDIITLAPGISKLLKTYLYCKLS